MGKCFINQRIDLSPDESTMKISLHPKKLLLLWKLTLYMMYSIYKTPNSFTVHVFMYVLSGFSQMSNTDFEKYKAYWG